MTVEFDIVLKEIVDQAYTAMPPIGNDFGAASNFAQRMLTKSISELRKSGQVISDDKAQELRATLNDAISNFDLSTIQTPSARIDETSISSKAKANIETLSSIITNSFHTSTDGSKDRTDLLTTRAMKEAVIYIKNCNTSWLECFRLKKQAKKIIRKRVVEQKSLE